MNDKYLDLIEDFTDIYSSKPIVNNDGGMGFNHSFALYCILKENKPSLVVESGVWKGQSTYIIENAVPEAEIICLDISYENIEYRSGKSEYIIGDFNCVDWSKYNIENSICFFDDHQNSMDRLKEMKWWGFNKCIFEDNYPVNEGDFYSIKQIQREVGHENIQLSEEYKPKSIKQKIKRNIEERVLNKYYFRQNMIKKPNSVDYAGFSQNISHVEEFPPVIVNEKNIWNKKWDGDYEKKMAILDEKKLDNFPKFKKYFNSLESEIKKREFEYGYFTYIEFNES